MSTTFKIKNYIKAKSPRRLRLLMFQKQIQLSMTALEFEVVFAKGEWYAWYYEAANTRAMDEVIDADTPNN